MGKLYDLLNTFIGKLNSCVKTVNGVGPDETGNVDVTGGGGTTEGAVLYTEQDLTEDQQAQARTNIGASNVVVDDTLAVSGAAADAAVVGNKLAGMDEVVTLAVYNASVAMPGSLKWDGVIGDKEYLETTSDSSVLQAFVRVSEEVPAWWAELVPESGEKEAEVLLGFTYSGMAIGQIAVLVISAEGVGTIEGHVLILPNDTMFGGVSLKKGVYFWANSALPSGTDASTIFVSALSIPPYAFPESSVSAADGYFETVTETAEVYSDTLTWDGDTTGLVSADIGGLYKVSDQILTADDLANGATVMTSEGAKVTIAYDNLLIGEGVILGTEGLFASVSTAGAAYMGFTFPEAGIYLYNTGEAFTSSLTVPGFDFVGEGEVAVKVIKTKHLPEALRFGDYEETVPSNTLEWDGDTTGREVQDDDIDYCKISDDAFEATDCEQGVTIQMTDADGNVSEFVGKVVEAEFGCYITHPDAEVAIPFVESLPSEYNGVPAGVYFIFNDTVYVSRITINGFSGFSQTAMVTKPMDAKYLPESAVQNGDESIILTSPGGKKFSIAVGDDGTITATEVTE